LLERPYHSDSNDDVGRLDPGWIDGDVVETALGPVLEPCLATEGGGLFVVCR